MRFWKVLVMSVLLGTLVLQAGCEPGPKKVEKLSIEPAKAEQVAEPAKKQEVSEQPVQEEKGNSSIKFDTVLNDIGDIHPDSQSIVMESRLQ